MNLYKRFKTMEKTKIKNPNKKNAVISSITPWLSIRNNIKAADFYKSAFGAVETYRLETPDGGLVVKLSIDGAEFWLSIESADDASSNVYPLGGNSVRMILTVKNPEEIFNRAIKAGASEVFPIGEDHGWKLGRLVDPFGLHWEIGHPI